MVTSPLLRALLVLAAAWLPGAASAEVEVKELNVSAATLEQTLDGKQTYNFAIVSDHEIVDGEGRHFSPKDVGDYLKRAKPEKKAAYVFWLPNPQAVAIVQAVVPAFADYGATVFVVRDMDHDKAPAAKPADASGKPKTMVLVGQPNPKALSAADPMPDLRGRPVYLRPGKLPPRVRYQFQPDAVVVTAAGMVEKLLLDSPPADPGPAFAKLVRLQPGAWKHLAHLPVLQPTKPLIATVELGHTVAKLEGRLVDTPEQFAAVVAEIRRLITADGGGAVRAMAGNEMNFWWTFIALDIEEPVFVVETNGHHYRFVVDCSDNRISVIDELTALPRS